MYAVELIMNITCLQVSTRINHLLLLTGIVAEMQLKPEISQNRLYKLCFLTADIWGRFAFLMSACLLIPLMLFRKCNGLQSPWLLPVLQTWLCRLGWEVVLLVPHADIPQPIRTMSPWDSMCIAWVIHLLRLLWQPRYAWTKKYDSFLLYIFGCLGYQRIFHLECNWIG